MKAGTSGPQTFRELGNEPGSDTGSVTIRDMLGKERVAHTTDCIWTDSGLFVSKNGKPVSFYPYSSVVEIFDTPKDEAGAAAPVGS